MVKIKGTVLLAMYYKHTWQTIFARPKEILASETIRDSKTRFTNDNNEENCSDK